MNRTLQLYGIVFGNIRDALTDNSEKPVPQEAPKPERVPARSLDLASGVVNIDGMSFLKATQW